MVEPPSRIRSRFAMSADVPPPSFTNRHSTTLKLFLIGFLALCLLIPVMMVSDIVAERGNRRNHVVGEISQNWGRNQIIIGPLLIVPISRSWTEKNAETDAMRSRTQLINAHFLPEALNTDIALNSSTRKRGLYEIPIYTAQITISGRFAKPNIKEINKNDGVALWENAYLGFAITDMRGAQHRIVLDWGGTPIDMQPGSRLESFPDGMHGSLPTPFDKTDAIDFRVSFEVNGSEGVSIAPLGRENVAKIAGNWSNPSFFGAFLPTERAVVADGFFGIWRLANFGRSYPQTWMENNANFQNNPAVFGVSLLKSVDLYRKTDRAIKYAVLFIATIFLVFFLFEVMLRLRIHPVQYIFVGISLCLFYLLLLSLAEFIDFGVSYGISAALSSGMISLYTGAIVKNRKRGALMACGLGFGYAFLFVLLHQEDYALVLGTSGLFVMLSIIMYVTRRVDWYSLAPSDRG
ncbi:inner membrane protein [Azospirillaceae bacterium]